VTEQRKTIEYDAVVLAGGRARRLGGVSKPLLRHGATTLLERALSAAATADRTVVVGPSVPADLLHGADRVQEDPPFSGPVAALAAALAHLDRPDRPEWLLLLAADLVDPAPAVEQLLIEAITADDTVASFLAIDDGGRPQLLLGLHRTRALTEALRHLPETSGAAVRALLAPLPRVLVRVPPGSTEDVDDADSAARHDIAVPTGRE
jgi:molybdopterin-guanine dinucleotide biosynthesis protein A